jgi:hypothetical protein
VWVQWTGPPACDQWCRAAASPSVALMPVRARTHVRPCALTSVHVRTMSTGRDRCMPPYKGCVAPSGTAATCHMAISATYQSAARVRAGSHCSTESRPSAIQWRVEPSQAKPAYPLGAARRTARPSPAAAAAAAASVRSECALLIPDSAHSFEQNSLRCRRLRCAALRCACGAVGYRWAAAVPTNANALA